MNIKSLFTIALILFPFFNQLMAQDVCIITTSKRGYTDGEYGIDSLRIFFHTPSLLEALSNEGSGDLTPYSLYEESVGYDRRSNFIIQHDTLYEYYPAVKKLSKPMMYLKGNEIYLGSYFNQNNGIKDYTFDNLLAGTLYGNESSGYYIEAEVGLSDFTTVASCKDNCPFGLMAAYAYIFTPSELMEEDE